MNTLSRAVTAHWFTDPHAYWVLRGHWRVLVESDRRHTLSASHHLLYLALLGKDWRRAFTPPTNPRKIANGAFTGWALFGALARLHSPWHAEALLAPFDGLVTPAILAALLPWLPPVSSYDFSPAQYARDAWPFDAYTLPAASAAPAPTAGPEPRHA